MKKLFIDILIDTFVIFPLALLLNFLLWEMTGTFDLVPFVKIMLLIYVFLIIMDIMASYLKWKR